MGLVSHGSIDGMATAIKTARSLLAPASNPPGGTTTSTTWNLTTALGGLLQCRITNGATGPTAGCEAQVQVSTDGASWREFSRQVAPTTANGAVDFHVEISSPALFARVVFGGNIGQAVTVEANGHELTAIG
jgi:hypothetical protein